MDEVIEERGVEDGGGIKLLSGDGGADDGEDAGTDDRADAERRERNGAESSFELAIRLLAIGDQLVDGLTGKKLVAQRSALSGRKVGSLQVHCETRQAYHAEAVPATMRAKCWCAPGGILL
jgi:hypothetical protein